MAKFKPLVQSNVDVTKHIGLLYFRLGGMHLPAKSILASCCSFSICNFPLFSIELHSRVCQKMKNKSCMCMCMYLEFVVGHFQAIVFGNR